MEASLLVDQYGAPVQSARYTPCPKCGRDYKQRVPSGGFGKTHFICLCGFDFNKELPCPVVAP